jgi:Xaa-Pro dipeptidase
VPRKICFKGFGLPTTAFVGHGLGLSVHEHPWIAKYDRFERPIEEGMVLCVEPYYIAGKDGFQLEDELIVTHDGFELITDQVDTRRLLQIAA